MSVKAANPVVETPAVETPPVETPPVETPPVETPPVETPAIETPVVETPAVETPAVETPPVTSWQESLPESLREPLAEFTTPEEAVDKFKQWAEDRKSIVTSPDQVSLAYADDVTVDENLDSEYKQFVVDNGLTNEQAQAVADFQHKISTEAKEAADKAVAEWEQKSIETLKGLGSKDLDTELAVVRKGVKAFASQELVDMLNVSGYGNHPHVALMFHKLGKLAGAGHVPTSGLKNSRTEEKRFGDIPMFDFKS